MCFLVIEPMILGLTHDNAMLHQLSYKCTSIISILTFLYTVWQVNYADLVRDVSVCVNKTEMG